MKNFNCVTALGLSILVSLPFQPIYAGALDDLATPEANLQTATKSATETTTATTTTTSSTYNFDSPAISAPTTSYPTYSTNIYSAYSTYSTYAGYVPVTSTSYSGQGGTYIEPQQGEIVAQPAVRAARGVRDGTPVTMPVVGTYSFTVSSNGKHQFSIVIDGVLHKIPLDSTRPVAGESITYNSSTKAFTATNGTFEISGHLNSAGGVADIYINNKVTGFKAMIDISWNLSTGAIIGQYDVRMIPLGGGKYRVDAFSWNYTPEKHYANYFINPTAAAELYAGARNETYTNLINLITSKSYLRQTYDFMTGTNIPNQSMLVYSTKDVTAGPFIKRASFTQGSTFVNVINPAGGTFKVALQQQFTIGSKTYHALSLYPAFHGVTGPVYSFGMFFYDTSAPYASQTPVMSSTFPSPGNPITIQVEGAILSISVDTAGVLTAQKIRDIPINVPLDEIEIGMVSDVTLPQVHIQVRINPTDSGQILNLTGTLNAQNQVVFDYPEYKATFTLNAAKTEIIESAINFKSMSALYVKNSELTIMSQGPNTTMSTNNPTIRVQSAYFAGDIYAELAAKATVTEMKATVELRATRLIQYQMFDVPYMHPERGLIFVTRMTTVEFEKPGTEFIVKQVSYEDETGKYVFTFAIDPASGQHMSVEGKRYDFAGNLTFTYTQVITYQSGGHVLVEPRPGEDPYFWLSYPPPAGGGYIDANGVLVESHFRLPPISFYGAPITFPTGEVIVLHYSFWAENPDFDWNYGLPPVDPNG